MSCGICKQLTCACASCLNNRPTEEFRQVMLSDTEVMCPECGERYDYETNAWLVNDYGHDSHKFFESLKAKEDSK